ncbi:MAG TPA: protein translocase subunit SecD [Rickettsiales bacterium]|nr:protein translocase subunit SecD [Rickettsiales bacterium]
MSKFFPQTKLNLGLDLRGGSQLVLEVDFDYYIKEQIGNLKDEIKNEFRNESVRAVVESFDDKITFKIFDGEQEKLAKKSVTKISKKVEIDKIGNDFIVYFSDSEINLMRKNLIQQSIEIIRRRVDESGTKEPTIQAQGTNRILLQVPGVENSDEIKDILGQTAKMTFHFVADETFTGGTSNDPRLDAIMDDEGRTYFIKKEVALSGELLTDANPTYHEGQPAVAFRFNSKGTRKFAKITAENIGKVFAIVLDGKVITAPRINGIINQGSGVISGNFTTKEAGDLALLLRAGALPAPLITLEERSVGPSLGLDSIKSGSLASLVGLAFVALLMLIVYKSFGIIADIALFINLAMILAILSLIGATLTLPGIAGIALTMGMSVDANVLIFERIKEELREKKSTLMALEQGFSQAFRTITDSNITTLITALFLYIFGNGPVKGFAVTLSIGIISSMFCAILLTRMMISIKIRRNKSQKLNLI